MSDTLTLESDSPLRVRVRPSVLLSIVDHHMRRPEHNTRVVGAILGRISGTTVDMLSVVPRAHQEDEDRVRIGLVKYEKFLELHRMAHPGQVIVGWYATVTSGEPVSQFTTAMHKEWHAESPNAHLAVDVSLRGNSVDARAFVAQPSNSYLGPKVTVMQEVGVDILASESERVAIDAMVRGADESEPSPRGTVCRLVPSKERLHGSMTKLQTMLTQVSEYVQAVVDGKADPDPVLGRAIADAVTAVPRMDPMEFDRIFTDSVQDLLSVGYLATITEAQLALIDKISKALPYHST